MKIKSGRFFRFSLAVILVCSAMMFLYGLSGERKMSILKKEGRVVDGQIIDAGKLGKSSWRKSHYIKVLYVNDKNKAVVRSFPVAADKFEQVSGADFVTVIFVPDHPEYTILAGMAGYSRIPLYTSAALFFIFLGLLALLRGNLKIPGAPKE